LLSVRASEVPTSKVTLLAEWNSKLSETMNRRYTAVTNQDSILRLLQSDEDAELDDICQERLSMLGIGCECIGLINGDVSLSCPDSSCLWCDENLEHCGTRSYSWELGLNGIPPDYIVEQTESFNYTTGETVVLAQSSCDVLDGSLNGCSECVAYVNDEEFTSCTMCADGFSYSVDCENLATNSSFGECLVGGPNYGIFQGIGFDIFHLSTVWSSHDWTNKCSNI
jgi:hypothetical protein